MKDEPDHRQKYYHSITLSNLCHFTWSNDLGKIITFNRYLKIGIKNPTHRPSEFYVQSSLTSLGTANTRLSRAACRCRSCRLPRPSRRGAAAWCRCRRTSPARWCSWARRAAGGRWARAAPRRAPRAGCWTPAAASRSLRTDKSISLSRLGPAHLQSSLRIEVLLNSPFTRATWKSSSVMKPLTNFDNNRKLIWFLDHKKLVSKVNVAFKKEFRFVTSTKHAGC